MYVQLSRTRVSCGGTAVPAINQSITPARSVSPARGRSPARVHDQSIRPGTGEYGQLPQALAHGSEPAHMSFGHQSRRASGGFIPASSFSSSIAGTLVAANCETLSPLAPARER